MITVMHGDSYNKYMVKELNYIANAGHIVSIN